MSKVFCKDCLEGPCPVVKNAKDILRVWVKERKRQLGKDCMIMGRDVPDKEAMGKALKGMSCKVVCKCKCHNKE